MVTHPTQCSCTSCNVETLSTAQKLEHIRSSENSRRDFLKKFSLSFAMASSGLPLAASAQKVASNLMRCSKTKQ
jgi:hypothetical protein